MITVWRTDADYNATRRRIVWNERIPERFPDVIVSARCMPPELISPRLARRLFWPSYRLLNANEFSAFPVHVRRNQENAVHMRNRTAQCSLTLS